MNHDENKFLLSIMVILLHDPKELLLLYIVVGNILNMIWFIFKKLISVTLLGELNILPFGPNPVFEVISKALSDFRGKRSILVIM